MWFYELMTSVPPTWIFSVLFMEKPRYLGIMSEGTENGQINDIKHFFLTERRLSWPVGIRCHHHFQLQDLEKFITQILKGVSKKQEYP